MSLDLDAFRSASHRNMIEHLTAPFQAGAVDSAVPAAIVGDAVRVAVSWQSREPLLVVGPSSALGGQRLTLTTHLVNVPGPPPLPVVEFAPYTEVGAYLPLYRPDTTAAPVVAPFTLIIDSLILTAQDGAVALQTPDVIISLLDFRLIEGVLGRTIFLLGAEKSRIRREAHEIAAARSLQSARDNALDRHGADLAVLRFADTLVTEEGAITTTIRREPDDEYRRRLSMYRPFDMTSRRSLDQVLNGPGAQSDPNAGVFGHLGFNPRFMLEETGSEFAVGMLLVSPNDPQLLQRFSDVIRRTRLLWPQDDAPTTAMYAQRFWASERRTEEDALRASLRQNFVFPANSAIAPVLATQLDLAGRCLRALGGPVPWTVLQTQDIAGGSRFQLGLGTSVQPLAPADLDALRAKVLDGSRQKASDIEVESAIQSMVPRSSTDDPDGQWLLEACGLKTVHRIDTTTLYLSHLSVSGLTITVGDGASSASVPLSAQYEAPGEPASNVVLVSGLANAAQQWTAAGHAAWQVLNTADAHTAWGTAVSRPQGDPALAVFETAGLPAVQQPAPVVETLQRFPPELLATIEFSGADANAILSGNPAVGATLQQLVTTLQANGIVSALPLITSANTVLLVVGVTGLPGTGINLSDRRATGFRWYVVPISGPGGTLGTLGSRNTFAPAGSGLTAVVVVAYARTGGVDPYEYRVDLPDGAVLSLLQYEFLMNVLDETCPIGVEVNTFQIRRHHVDLNGDGTADPLLPTASRTYRPFRRTRQRGSIAVDVPDIAVT